VCDPSGIKVVVVKVEIQRATVLTHLMMEKGSEHRRVLHVHFTGWPDHGLPKNTRECVSLVSYKISGI
jgi:hypothetical protein